MNSTDRHLHKSNTKAAADATTKDTTAGTTGGSVSLTKLSRVSRGIAAAGLLGALVGCSTTQPTLPTVDDTQRRPVNSAAALELLTCRAEAQALRLNLFDPAHAAVRGGACTGVPASASGAKPDAGPKASSGSSRAVFEFEAGKTELVLDDSTRQVLRRAAQNADVVLVHAAGNFLTSDVESNQKGNGLSQGPGQADLEAQVQAQATARALVAAGIEPQKLRVSWSVVDVGPAQASRARQAGGTVEVEFVERATRLLFSKPVDQTTPPAVTKPPAPTTDSVKPAVAALHATGHSTAGSANKKN